MYTTQKNRYSEIERYLDRQEEVGTDRCIQHRRIEQQIEIERQLDRQEEEVGTDRCIQLRRIGTERQRDSQIDRRRWYVQIDVFNLEEQVQRVKEIVRQTGGGRYRQMYTTQKNRYREIEIERQEEEVGRQIE